jgi:hypothetical protein
MEMMKRSTVKQLGLFDAEPRPLELTAVQKTKALILLQVLLTEASGKRNDGSEIRIQEARDEDHG